MGERLTDSPTLVDKVVGVRQSMNYYSDTNSTLAFADSTVAGLGGHFEPPSAADRQMTLTHCSPDSYRVADCTRRQWWGYEPEQQALVTFV